MKSFIKLMAVLIVTGMFSVGCESDPPTARITSITISMGETIELGETVEYDVPLYKYTYHLQADHPGFEWENQISSTMSTEQHGVRTIWYMHKKLDTTQVSAQHHTDMVKTLLETAKRHDKSTSEESVQDGFVSATMSSTVIVTEGGHAWFSHMERRLREPARVYYVGYARSKKLKGMTIVSATALVEDRTIIEAAFLTVLNSVTAVDVQ